ncbi:M48 family metallopeptidase [Thaumasiovibrio subtropicus]|uniref:M48 metallopeptidase family protein n=1 Tax=Thaumasiovibrio subtropicus TaxID=1891207 RepID=UPI000B3641F1|nr:YgjP-like metallopeptidase domain-containing protein [Thaumasiovibrio subtropicus]
MKYLSGYPTHIISQAQRLVDENRLGDYLCNKYPASHSVNSDKALYQFVMEMKNRYLKKSSPISKVCFDKTLRNVESALGTHTRASRVQGGKLKAKKEIRIATLFKEAPLGLLEMIVVHELAHVKETEHNKSFYQLCCHMLPDYHQRELDMRLYLHWFGL